MDKRNRDTMRRVRKLQRGTPGKGPVVYWMWREQRVEDNWALLAAQQEAVIQDKPLLVVFCSLLGDKSSNRLQMSFMQPGLVAIEQQLADLGISWLILHESPEKCLPRLLQYLDAYLLISDFDPLKPHRNYQKVIRGEISTPFYEVDSHNIIPAWVVSEKREYAAYTIRPKINRLLDEYLTDIPAVQSHQIPFDAELQERLEKMHIPFKPPEKHEDFLKTGGQQKAKEAAEDFIKNRLQRYGEKRNDPCTDGQSRLSPYLHLGQLSPQRLAWMVRQSKLPPQTSEPFLEELIVRRELSDNFCLYEEHYDGFEGFTEWAKKTLDEHRSDKREYTYSIEELEAGKTHEQLWNCCQLDLVHNGRLHGYLRMYWAKKILEWTKDPESAFKCAIRLNDHYALDGCDPNGYTGVAWSVGGVHDRAWPERKVFGKVRYMNEAGCRRKFDVKGYIESVMGKKAPTLF